MNKQTSPLLALALCCVLANLAMATSRPDACATVRCGYGSRCELDRNGKARCVCPEFCPAIYQPVCGTDGQTYGNKCELGVAACKKKEDIKVKHEGQCERLIYEPPPSTCQSLDSSEE